MAVSRGLIPFVFIFSCLIFVIFIQNRLHNNTKHKSLHAISRTSLSPSPAPKAAFSAAAAGPAYTSANSSTSTTSTKSGIYNVLSFGAVGDGVADDTDAFKLAWDTACQSDEDSSPTLLVPNGGHSFLIQSTIFTGPCKSSLILQIDGNVKPPNGPNSWPKNKSKRQWLVFYRIHGMSMQGDGLIDGRGEKWWNLPCKPHKGPKGRALPGPCDSPTAIRFFMSSNLTVKGIKIKNSPQFHIRFDNCQNVHIDSLTINSPFSSPNTDGIHIENTNDVKIYNSIISNGDDCLSIGAGCYNVDIRNVTCGPSHGISIGSLGGRNSRACVSNITVTNSVIKNSDNGVRIKTWQGGSGQVRNVMFNNIKMDNVRNPIMIDQYYCQTKKCANQTSAVFISDITYMNIKGTYDVRSPPMHLACSESIPCTNLTLSDIELLPSQGKFLANPVCWNAYGDSKTLAIPPVLSCLLAGIPVSLPENLAGRC